MLHLHQKENKSLVGVERDCFVEDTRYPNHPISRHDTNFVLAKFLYTTAHWQNFLVCRPTFTDK